MSPPNVETPSDELQDDNIAPSWTVGIDIGGTFTDLVAIDTVSGRQITAKVLTDTDDPAQGLLNALEAANGEAELTLSNVSEIVHGTTLAINTVIERKGASVGLVTTQGFRDIIEMGRGNRYDLFDLQIPFQEPLVERRLRVEVAERIGARGQIVNTLAADSVTAATSMLRANRAESVAVCLVNSYANPQHEREVDAILNRELDGLPVSLSSDVGPVIREYERSVATVINAYVSPKVSSYLARLEDRLGAAGYRGPVQIMRSDGGWFGTPEAARWPVRILESGPSAGAVAAAMTAERLALRQAVAFDMGGTTAKASLVLNGRLAMTDTLEVARLDRFKKGSGLPVRLPSVDLLEIGAGGGSIASLSALGLVQVGPTSSGSVPGPACYGKGGDEPTVTDADLLLGFINPVYFAGGSIVLDLEASRRAMAEKLLSPSDLTDETAAAWAVHDVVNENMARAMRLHCIEHGVDPAEVTIIATGGAGPVHAAGVMTKVGAKRIICPANVGVASAFGLLQAPQTDELTLTDIVLLEELTPVDVEDRFANLTQRLIDGRAWADLATIERFLSLRLQGQGYEVHVAHPAHGSSVSDVVSAFAREYELRFGRPPSQGASVEAVDWIVRLTRRGSLDEIAWAAAPASLNSEEGTARSRQCYWGPSSGWLETSVCKRAALGSTMFVEGPALIEEPTSTIAVMPGQSAHLGKDLAVYVERGANHRCLST